MTDACSLSASDGYTGTRPAQRTREILLMMTRRLLSLSASLALAGAGFIAPAFVTQGSAALASPAVSAPSSVSVQAPTSVTQTTQAQMQTVTMPAKRIRIRTHSNNPTITIISWILAILIVGGGILVRYAIFKATQRNSTPTTTFNGPNGPQYGVTGPSYGTANYPQAGAPQPGSQVYGTGTYGNQQGGYPSYGVQGGQSPYGTGY